MASPRRRISRSRWIAGPVLMIVVAGVMFQSARALASFVLDGDIRDLAETIEAGQLPEANYLYAFVARNGLDRPYDGCGDNITRARLTISLATLAAATKGADLTRLDAALANAREIAGHRLQCNPLDGNAWLRFAEVNAQASGPSPDVIQELRLSYWAAPAEQWILEARLPFATRLYLAGVKGFGDEYLRDLRYYVTYESIYKVAGTYVATAPPIRELLHPLIAAQPEERRKAMVAEIDRLGMVFEPAATSKGL